MKGSIEGVLKRCKANADTAAFIKRAEKEAGTGHRILALAAREGTFSGPREDDEKNLKFLALLVFSDPLRHTVKDSIKKIANKTNRFSWPVRGQVISKFGL